jgi:hypothetical protein
MMTDMVSRSANFIVELNLTKRLNRMKIFSPFSYAIHMRNLPFLMAPYVNHL